MDGMVEPAAPKRTTGRSSDLARFAKLDRQRRALEDKLKAVKADLEDVEPKVLSHFEKSGIDKVRVNKMTVYLRRQLWAGRADGVDKEAAVVALRAAGMPEFTEGSVKTQALSAWVREMDKTTEGGWEAAIPEKLKGIIKVSEVLSVQTRMSD